MNESNLKYDNIISNLAREFFYDRDDRQDAEQEARIKLLNLKLPDGNPGGFVYTVIKNLFIDIKRKGGVLGSTPALDNISEDVDNDPLTVMINSLDEDSLSERLSDASNELYETAMMFYVKDMSYKDIANALNIPTGTVSSRMSAVRKLLKRQANVNKIT